jgi:beta-N-acetylhexosaminidase
MRPWRGNRVLSQAQRFRASGFAVAAMLTVLSGANAEAAPVATGSPADANLAVTAHHLGDGNVAVLGTADSAARAQILGTRSELDLVSQLSARQLAGQRVIYSYTGLTPPASLLRLIRHGYVGGVIFFGANISGKAQIAAVIKQLEAANASATNPARDYPLLLMTDQEGGEVRRLPGAPVHSEKWIGDRPTAAQRAYQASEAGSAAAANLRSVGMNVNLAPVLDVYRQAGDFDDQYQRSYSMNQNVVSLLGADFIKAQQAGGVAATAKHFPGLGAATASQNTDLRPVTIDLSKAELETADEHPYKAAISAGVKLVMVSWAVYPQLGSDLPAGLSSAIVQGQLRTRLGFQGVTITDAIGADALTPYGSIQNRALMAAEAGMQLILSSGGTVGEGNDCAAALEAGYRDDKLAKGAFEATVSQILALRASLPA